MMGFEEIKKAEVLMGEDDYKITPENVDKVLNHITEDCVKRLNDKEGFLLTLDNNPNTKLLCHILSKSGVRMEMFIPDYLDEESIKKSFEFVGDLTTNYNFTKTRKENLLVIGNGDKIDNYLINLSDSYLPLGDLLQTDIVTICNKLGYDVEPSGVVFDYGITIREMEWAIMYIDEYTYVDNGERVFDDCEVFLLNEREQEVLSLVIPQTIGNVKADVCEITNEILF